ncbi:hypothetical protein IVB45_20800 [Bradyrhizobium sp. 4]|uniref:hypothetical protein n=1 Tax=unclassified Bradyrhizobium TaxID=2631580 RepID=UPI001FF8A01B|nr:MULTISPECIES: hypothetical protein [unclassified Bradyrhizobium]MCK1402341.1 hypothetical protein [Bradyrhizobium sp. 39]MCK1747936.1 hypothetical protein [Bradyrhizobium sp. 135]UPJ32429.1 hypothetical protein IVB45_20800 [Bradyrhizobium sp. 4]
MRTLLILAIALACPPALADDIVQCKFFTKTIPLPHEVCVALVGTSFNMRDQADRVHLDHEKLQNLCIADVGRKLPGKSLAEYRATCEDIYKLTF